MPARSPIPAWFAWASGRPAGAGHAPDPNKRYITLAPIATVLGPAFKLSDPENCWAVKKIWALPVR